MTETLSQEMRSKIAVSQEAYGSATQNQFLCNRLFGIINAISTRATICNASQSYVNWFCN